MSTERRFTVVLAVAVLLAAAVWVAALPGWVTFSTALWATLAIGLATVVVLKFKRHAELPDSVRLH